MPRQALGLYSVFSFFMQHHQNHGVAHAVTQESYTLVTLGYPRCECKLRKTLTGTKGYFEIRVWIPLASDWIETEVDKQ